MAITHTAAQRNAQALAILAAIDVDGAAGNMVLQTAGGAIDVATCVLSFPAGVVTAEDLVFSAIAQDPSALAGTITEFKVETNLGVEVFRGSVTTVAGGGDIEFINPVIALGEPVDMDTFTYTASL